MQLFTGRGVVGLAMLITINPATAYTRRAQWQFAIVDVMRNAWFGFRPETYHRPFWLAPSIDNWWLFIMMRSGIPSLVLLALCALSMWIIIARRESDDPLFRNLRTGWGLMMIAVILGAATVTFFGKGAAALFILHGIGSCSGYLRAADEGREEGVGDCRRSAFAIHPLPPENGNFGGGRADNAR